MIQLEDDIYIQHLYVHDKTGKPYAVLDCGKMKINDKWEVCVIYKPLYINPITTFVRSITDFKQNFSEYDNNVEL